MYGLLGALTEAGQPPKSFKRAWESARNKAGVTCENDPELQSGLIPTEMFSIGVPAVLQIPNRTVKTIRRPVAKSSGVRNRTTSEVNLRRVTG